jgi:hypothetical protein
MSAERPGGSRGGGERGPARLRGHHLICLQFFRGEGYLEAFVDNLTGVIERATDAPALLVDIADDVCAACPGLGEDGTCADPAAGEAEIRRLDQLAFDVLGVRPGSRLSLAEARARLSADAIATGRWRFEACAGCAWEDVCEHGWNALLGEAENASD